MSEHVLEHLSSETPAVTGRRHPHHIDETLVLTELDADAVVDHLDNDYTPVELITFGTVREVCPHCPQSHLRLVLRQQRVRVAHLFCGQCKRCFDARYTNGEPALTI